MANAAKRVFVLAAAAVFLGEVPSTRPSSGPASLWGSQYGAKRDAAKKNVDFPPLLALSSAELLRVSGLARLRRRGTAVARTRR